MTAKTYSHCGDHQVIVSALITVFRTQFSIFVEVGLNFIWFPKGFPHTAFCFDEDPLNIFLTADQ